MIEEGSRGEEARRKGKELEDKIEFEVKKRLKLHMQKEKETLRLQYEKVIKKEIDSRMKKIAELILANFKNIGKDVKSWSLDYSDNWNQELVEKVYREIITDKSYLENHSFQ